MAGPKYLIPRNDLCMSDAMPFSQHWQVRIPMPIEELGDLGIALQNSYSNFRPGDLVGVCAFTDKNFRQLLEVADFRVVSCDMNQIVAVQVTETIRVPGPKPELVPDSQQNLKIVNMRGAWEVRDGLENVIDQFVDEQQAKQFLEEYIKGTKPPEQPKVEDRSNWYVKKAANGKWHVRSDKNEIIREFSRRDEAEAYISKQPATV